ncbi:MAG: HD domain-containing phosphohydrolase [Deinococcales bacterium]
MARFHHERFDGSGYPFHLQGPAIPLVARIIAVADVYDALRHERSYKDAWSLEKTLDYIKGRSGVGFDPYVVEAFLSYLKSQTLTRFFRRCLRH